MDALVGTIPISISGAGRIGASFGYSPGSRNLADGGQSIFAWRFCPTSRFPEGKPDFGQRRKVFAVADQMTRQEQINGKPSIRISEKINCAEQSHKDGAVPW